MTAERRISSRETVRTLLVAFSTASSSATLPVAMRVADERLGIDKAISMTVLPAGAAIGNGWHGHVQTALIVGFILPFDRLLDMTRTVASANLAVTTTVARLEGELDENNYLDT